MIPDQAFKQLNHNYKGYSIYLKGNSIEPGYKPDFVLKNNDEYIILESENSSSRKTFVGGLIKAAHFLQKERKGMLIFVIVPKSNTKAKSIANHLKIYLKWVQSISNLQQVYVIEASLYYQNDILLSIDGNDFIKNAFKV